VRIWKWMIRLSCASSALLAGCSFAWMFPETFNIGAYGMASQPHDPTVSIESFSYTPASPIHRGDKLVLQATLNKPTEAGYVRAVVKKPELAVGFLNDWGRPPDAVAGDGVFTGELVWKFELGAGSSLPVWAELQWSDGAPSLKLDGPPLTVLP
jgi:hypothetical protein